MSTLPETEFDLEKLFLPAWAQEPSSANRYARHTGDDRPSDRRRDDRSGPRRGPRRDGPPSGNRDQGRPPRNDRPGGPRRPGERPQFAGGPRPGFRRDDRDERREAPLPLPEISIALIPDDKGVDSLSRQIKISGRSFPLFDIAQMILRKPERQQVRFEVRKKPDGQTVQPLFLCAIDDTLWLSEEEAVAHALGRHFGMFYQAEKTPTDPPKGTYTFVAQCGMSGMVLGPPNYHDYQNQLRKLHAERFSRMPFETFKARVKIVKEEAVVKKWIEDQSFKTDYLCLNVPDALRLASREEVEKHFREVHLPNIIKSVEKHTLNGAAGRLLPSPALQRLLRHAWEDQKRFPLQIATVLSQQFAAHGLQFFKVNKTITHVSVARPNYLDMEATPVSTQVRRIVEFINATPKCTRRQLIEAIAPTPARATPDAGTGAAPGSPPVEAQPTPEQAAVSGDLHWLIHQGHVIEFANGILETAKKPLPRPPKPQRPEAKPPTPADSGSTAALPAPQADHTAGTPPVSEPSVAPSETVTPIPEHTSTGQAAEPTHEPAAT